MLTAVIASNDSERLKQAVEQAAAALLPEEQDLLADYILKLLADDNDAKWNETFAGEKFDRLAENARAEIRAGRAAPLDPDKL
jgi:hypothetical protein